MGRFDESAEEADQKTDEKFSVDLGKLKLPPPEVLKSLFPTPVDKKNLDDLLNVVRKSTGHMECLSKLKENAETLGVAAIKLIKAVAKV